MTQTFFSVQSKGKEGFKIKSEGAEKKVNKTIGDEGITVDFSIIKVYTSN